MQKESFLNDIKHRPQLIQTHTNKINTIKFATTFNPKTGPAYRHRQIKILQIDNHSTLTNRQPLSKTKIPPPFNLEPNKPSPDSVLKVEPTKR